MDYEDSSARLHGILSRINALMIFMIYFKPKTNKLNDVLTKDPRLTRFDVLGRALTSTFIYSYKVQDQVSCIVFIDSDRKLLITVGPNDVRTQKLITDEDAVNLLRSLVMRGKNVIEDIDYQEVLRIIHSAGYRMYYLHEGGELLQCLHKGKLAFVVCSNIDPPKPHVEHEVFSIGPLPYQVNHVITCINWLYNSRKWCLSSS